MKKAGRQDIVSFGGPAFFCRRKTRSFPSPAHAGFGFIADGGGRRHSVTGSRGGADVSFGNVVKYCSCPACPYNPVCFVSKLLFLLSVYCVLIYCVMISIDYMWGADGGVWQGCEQLVKNNRFGAGPHEHGRHGGKWRQRRLCSTAYRVRSALLFIPIFWRMRTR